MIFTAEKFERFLSRRSAAHREALLKASRIEKPYVIIDQADFEALQIRFIKSPSPTKPGLGDLVAAVATPIARALKLSCIDPATRELRPESPCAQRKAALNRLTGR